MVHDLKGREVSEEKAATHLGFKDVYELRRWNTELGQKLWNASVNLRTARADLDSFRWHLMRMEKVVRECRKFIRKCEQDRYATLLILAVGVVLGEEVDWNGRLKGPFDLRVRTDSNRLMEGPFVVDTRLFR